MQRRSPKGSYAAQDEQAFYCGLGELEQQREKREKERDDLGAWREK